MYLWYSRVAVVLTVAMVSVPPAGASELPTIEVDRLADAVRASEQAVRTFQCRATVTVLREEAWRKEYVAAPAAIPFESSPLVREVEWAFVGAPHGGLLRSTEDGTMRVLEQNPDGGYAWHGRYAQRADRAVFDGQYQTVLSVGVGKVSEVPPPSGLPPADSGTRYHGTARVRAERAWQDEYAGLLQAHSFWLARKPLSECLEDGTAQLVGVERVGNVPAYRVDVSLPDMDGGLVRLWLDPGRGFSIVKRQCVNPWAGECITDETLTLELVEWSAGVWFPRELIRAEPISNSFYHVVVEQVRINEDLPTDLFSLDIPPGVTVIDEVRGVRYEAGWAEEQLDEVVEESLQRIAEEMAEEFPHVRATGAQQAGSSSSSVPARPVEAPASPAGEPAGSASWFWLAGILAGVGTMGLLLWVWRSRRMNSDGPA